MDDPPSLVLDLWGGGESARQMSASGLRVLSVDDGRNADLTVMERDAREHGYEVAVGPAKEFTERTDVAWLDFCGHWSPDIAKTIRSCRHMRVVYVTLMPERTPIGSRLSPREWGIALEALIGDALGMKVKGYKYRRASGLFAWCFRCEPKSTGRKKAHERWKERYHSDPEFREHILELNRRNRQRKRDAVLALERTRKASARA